MTRRTPRLAIRSTGLRLTALAISAATLLISARPAPGGDPACTGRTLGGITTSAGSRACLGCHDGTTASNVIPTVSRTSQLYQYGQHPTLVSYADAYRRDPTGFIPPSELDPALRLEGGKVGCVTCHSVDSREKDMLIQPTRGGDLCLTCHIR